MTPEEQRIAIAKACGWFESPMTWVRPDGQSWSEGPPDYLNDLNAMHEAEKVLTYWPDYLFHLRSVVGGFSESQCEWCDYDWFNVTHATAAQRAEAFLRTLNLWTE